MRRQERSFRQGEARIAFSYVDPQGDPAPDPSPKRLREILLHEGEGYWGDSGDATLAWIEYSERGYRLCTDRPSLIFFLREPYGFHFVCDLGGKRLITYDEAGDPSRVRCYLGGEPLYLPRAGFVSREQGWEIVQTFLRTHRPAMTFGWADRASLDFDETSPGG